MARARSPDRDKAFNIWLDSKGEILLKDIANQLGVSDGQIRKWKNLDKWHDKLKGNVTNEKVQSKSNVTFENVDAKKQNKKITKKLIESVEENEDLGKSVNIAQDYILKLMNPIYTGANLLVVRKIDESNRQRIKSCYT